MHDGGNGRFNASRRQHCNVGSSCRLIVECGTDGGPNHVGAAEDAVVRRILSRRAATFAAAVASAATLTSGARSIMRSHLR
jgi:hypothetical protein